MKAILVIDVPDDFETKTAIAIVDVKNEKGEGVTAMCSLKPMSEEEMVDAIPISFLEERIAFNQSWGCYGYAKGLQSAIEEWKKHNESNISY